MTVRTTINYFDPHVPRGRFDLVEPERSVMRFEPAEVTIRDIRDHPHEVSIAEQGFTWAKHRSAVARASEMQDVNLTMQDGIPPINQTYYAELAPLIAKLSGAREVVPQATGLTVRFSDRAARKSWAAAAGFVHLDVTTASVERFLQPSLAALGRPVAPWRRVVLYQTWRAVTDPPQDNLLCVCDRRSVPASDVVFYDAVMAQEGATLAHIEARSCRYRADHRWWYVSDMGEEDLLVFIGYDSDDPDGVQPFHTGFDVPGQADAIPRGSLEARFFALYD